MKRIVVMAALAVLCMGCLADGHRKFEVEIFGQRIVVEDTAEAYNSTFQENVLEAILKKLGGDEEAETPAPTDPDPDPDPG
jgi:hypothetical protein